MKPRIIIVGKAATGKTILKNRFIEKGYVPSVSFTTRPPREGEVHGIDYTFISEKEFKLRMGLNAFYETAEFGGWMYGTGKTDWENDDIFIMTPSGIANITPEDRKHCFIIFIDLPHHIRRYRLEQRKDADSAGRRLLADEKDFTGFKDYDLLINSPYF